MGVRGGRRRRLSDEYRFEGFRPDEKRVRGVFGGPPALIVPLKRRSKKLSAGSAEHYTTVGTIASVNWYEMFRAETRMST